MNNFEIECLECGWQGKKSDLLKLKDQDKERICCPDCGSMDMKDLK
jgi:DNA-directed RNA polymerase subunit RPC12/RpoP